MSSRTDWPEIDDVLRGLGVSERTLKRMNRRRRPKRADRPRCTARRRDGQQCQAHAVLDKSTWTPLHGGKCRVHGGVSTGPRTLAGKAAIADSNHRRAQLQAALVASGRLLEVALDAVAAALTSADPMPRPDPMPRLRARSAAAEDGGPHGCP